MSDISHPVMYCAENKFVFFHEFVLVAVPENSCVCHGTILLAALSTILVRS